MTSHHLGEMNLRGSARSQGRAGAAVASTARPPSLYAFIREELRELIISGAWQPNDLLPSERDLMAQYGVSRITVRQALRDLQKESLIFKLAGKGAYVAQTRPFQELGRLQGFAEAMEARGHETYNRVLAIEHRPASDLVASRLALAAGAPVTELRRVRYLDRQPVSLDITWVGRDLGTRLEREDLASRDIFLIIENDCGMPLGHADLVIDAGLADAALGKLLGISDGAPVLRIERLTHDGAGRPIDYEHLYCRADNFQYRLRIERR
jgi:GntR family transcriptional regulator